MYVPAVIARALGFLAFWLMLAGADPADLPVAAIAVGFATWASLRLLPPGTRRWSPAGVARLVLRFPRQSVVAGLDVALRAFDPKLPLHPGFVAFRTELPPGPTRQAFCTLMSLLPGTVPAGLDEAGALLFHCIDLEQPVLEQLAREEQLFTQALPERRGDG